MCIVMTHHLFCLDGGQVYPNQVPWYVCVCVFPPSYKVYAVDISPLLLLTMRDVIYHYLS